MSRADEEFRRGDALRREGKLEQALRRYRRAVELDPRHVAARNHLAGLCRAGGDLAGAAAHLAAALEAAPADADTHNNLGTVLKDLGRLPEALASYRRAIELAPGHAEAHNNLGNALRQMGQPAAAVEHLSRAVQLQPGYAEAHLNLSAAWHAAGRLDAAIAACDAALKAAPHYPQALDQRGCLLRDLGRWEEALACHREAAQREPRLVDARLNAGVAFTALGRLPEAHEAYRDAARLAPGHPEAQIAHASALKDAGEMEDAARAYDQAIRVDPRPRARAASMHARATLLPPVYQSAAEVQTWRERLLAGVRALHADGVTLDVTHESAAPVFLLAYQGLEDRAVQQDLARLVRAPQVPPPARARGGPGPLRVGFISAHLCNHTISSLFRGLIRELPRPEFQVTVLACGRHRDAMAQFVRASADRYVEVPRDLAAARETIRRQELDLLYYTDIGMEPLTYSLAFSRLAPVQCATVGHPLTTGIDTVDWFVASDAMEPPDAASHYTERLARLDALYTYYYRPALAAGAKDRAALGLPAGRHLYGCPQTLFKLHPDFDAVLAGILRGDPDGVLVMVKSRYASWQRALTHRLRRTMPDVLDRVIFLEPLPFADFLALNAAVDVLLDPLYFGGGNTSFEGLAMGTPIVTQPGRFNRGRVTYALYRTMGVTDCVVESAQSYVAKALALGTDRAYRAEVSARIRAASPVLFESRPAVDALARFFREAIERARRA